MFCFTLSQQKDESDESLVIQALLLRQATEHHFLPYTSTLPKKKTGFIWQDKCAVPVSGDTRTDIN
jgi:hypothetical protein